ncbi:MAG: class I SAM-dependent methyltransferase [Pseudolabrys sp.]|nr:class I SAM-dependent methyltransferase [Pseudolabrys sp.]
MSQKSNTDLHWNSRAISESDGAKVNIADTVQRDLELQYIFNHLSPSMRLLEVGCGNGYVTDQLRARVAHVDAFDYAENMVSRGKEVYGETNNRFFVDSVLDPKNARGPYDAALCVRVLINLRDLSEQIRSIRNIHNLLKPGGVLILIEGYKEGFAAISDFRQKIGIEPLKPAAINYYSGLSELMPTIQELFAVADTFHTGLFDFLTRIILPAVAGPGQASGPGQFHAQIEPVVRAYDGREFAQYARLHGFVLTKR